MINNLIMRQDKSFIIDNKKIQSVKKRKSTNKTALRKRTDKHQLLWKRSVNFRKGHLASIYPRAIIFVSFLTCQTGI